MAWSTPPPKKMKPSASRAARSNAALARSTKPDRNGARRLRHECGSVNPVEAAREVDDRFCEQPAEQPDLLLLSGATGTEVLSEGLVLDVVPADSRHRGAADRRTEDQHRPPAVRRAPSGAAEGPGSRWRNRIRSVNPGQIGEHHERIVERVVLGVGPSQRRRSIGVNGTEHMVVGQEVVKAQVLDRSPKSAEQRSGSPRSSFCG